MKNSPLFGHVYCFLPYNLSCPSARYRAYFPLSNLLESGQLTVDFMQPSASWKKRIAFLCIYLEALIWPKKNSRIFIQKVCSTRYYGYLLRFLVFCRPNISFFDLDDAENYRQPTQNMHFFLRKAKACSLGSQALKDYALAFNANCRIHTSAVPQQNLQTGPKHQVLRLVWLGDLGDGRKKSKAFSHKTNVYSLLFPALKKLQFPIELHLLGVKKKSDIPEIQAYFASSPHIHLVIPQDLNWVEDDWVYTYLSKMDLGLAPLVDHPFNQAKSAFKAKQYLAVGLPVLASDIGENSRFVQEDKNGFLFRNEAELLQQLAFFQKVDAEQMQAFQRAAKTSFQEFSMARYEQQLLNMLFEVD